MSIRKANAPLSVNAHDRSAKILLGHNILGDPAVKVDLQSYVIPEPVYTDPTLLRRMGAEFLQAATYLERRARAAG